MAENENASPGVETVVEIPQADTSPLSIMQAARELKNFRQKRDEAPAAPSQAAAPETPADPAPEATSEVPTEAPVEPELPTIDAPRSWTKEWKEEFKSYPRDLQ